MLSERCLINCLRELEMKVVGFCMVLWIVGVLLLSFNCFGGVIGVDRSTLVSGEYFLVYNMHLFCL